MKQIKRQMYYSAAAVSIMLGLVAVPVSAEHGGGADSSATGSTLIVPLGGPQNEQGSRHVSGGSGSGSESTSSSGSQSENESVTEDSGLRSGKLHIEAEQLLGQQRKHGKEHSEAERQKACVQRQVNINKHEAQFSTQAAKHLTTFNSIFTKLQAFHDSKGLTVMNYDALVTDATAKQASAQSAVDALKAVDVKIDCSQPDPASTVATIKTAVKNARTALQDYRTSLKNLVVAMKGASASQDNNQNTGGTQ